MGVIAVSRVAFLSRGAGQSIAEATLFGAVVGLILGGLVLLLGSVACRGNRLGDRLQAGAAVIAGIESRVQEGEQRVGAERDAARTELTAAEDARAQANDTREWVIGEYRQAVLLATGWLGLTAPPVDLVVPRELEIADAAARQVQRVTAKLDAIDQWLSSSTPADTPDGRASAQGTALELAAGAPPPMETPPAPAGLLVPRIGGVVPLSPQLPPPPTEPWWLLLAGAAAAVAIAAGAAFIAPTPEGEGLLTSAAPAAPPATAAVSHLNPAHGAGRLI